MNLVQIRLKIAKTNRKNKPVKLATVSVQPCYSRKIRSAVAQQRPTGHALASGWLGCFRIASLTSSTEL